MCSTGRFVGTVVVIDMYELLYCVLVVDCEVGDVVKEVVWFAAAIWLLLILLKKKNYDTIWTRVAKKHHHLCNYNNFIKTVNMSKMIFRKLSLNTLKRRWFHHSTFFLHPHSPFLPSKTQTQTPSPSSNGTAS